MRQQASRLGSAVRDDPMVVALEADLPWAGGVHCA
jgi:hypothetical protein